MQKAKIKNQDDLWGFQYYFKKLFLSPIEENYAFVLGKKKYKKIMLSCEEFTKTILYIP